MVPKLRSKQSEVVNPETAFIGPWIGWFEDLQVIIVSYSRKALNQTGDGHYSPIGGYHSETDQVLILDVARFKYPPHWVPLTTLWESMAYVDAETGRSRGFMILSSNDGLKASRLALVWRYPECSEDAKRPESYLKSFSQALLADPLPELGKAAAAEVIRRAEAFIESPHMPLMVVYKIPGISHNEDEVLEAARALRKFAEDLNSALGEECLKPEEVGDKVCEFGPNRLAAALLAIKPSTWEHALGRDPKDSREARAQTAWNVLQPLLLDLPEVLRKDVASLRKQWADLLTAREEMCGAICAGTSSCERGTSCRSVRGR